MNIRKLLAHGGRPYRNEEAGGGEADGGAPPPAETTPTELPPLIDENLNFSEGYQTRIGEYAEGANFKNLADVFKTNKELHATLTKANMEKAELAKKLETGAVEPPKKELPADANAFKEALELPELPEGVNLSDDVLQQAIEYSMEKGYGPKELSDFLAFDLKRAELEAEAAKNEQFARVSKAKDTIIGAVGEQNYDVTIADAQFVAETIGLPLEADDLVSQPNMVIALSKLKQALSEGSLKGATVNGVQVSNGSKLAQAEDIVSNPENPLNAAFHDASHPQYLQAQTEHARLITESAQ